MKQYKITSENIAPVDQDGDTYLAPDDPAQEIRRMQFLGGLGAQQRLAEYNNNLEQGSNITVTAAENARIMREKNIQPGTPEWFKLWFSLPYMTGERKNG
jgi:hypothetical protein